LKRFWKRWRRQLASDYPQVLIHQVVLPTTIQALQQSRDEKSAHEGIVYWAGKATNSVWIITTSIAPKAETTWGSFATSAASNAKVITFLATNGLELLAQVHSHPGSRVDHSDGDDHGALMPYENYLSLIVPNYAKDGILPLTRCGIHRFNNGQFKRLTTTEIKKLFQIIPSHQNFE
jgi:hypothetical protein